MIKSSINRNRIILHPKLLASLNYAPINILNYFIILVIIDREINY